MLELGFITTHIYRGLLVISDATGLGPNPGSGRVLIKPKPTWGFLFLNPNPTVFFIGPGKTRPIRVRSGQVPASRVAIAIPTVYIGFPTHDLLFIPFFPSFSFLFTFTSFFSSSCYFICFGVVLLPKLSLFPFHCLVIFSCSSLCFCFFMVDYSLVRLDCPSVSFFFTRLCSLLEAVGRRRPRVGLFIEKTCPYRFVLFFLFP